MTKTLTEQLQGIRNAFPTEPFTPAALDTGVAEQLRDMAAQIETGAVRITHFSLTTDADSRQQLQLNVE
jgi:hypothetical protein